VKAIVPMCIIVLLMGSTAKEYPPTSDYRLRQIEGWKVLVNKTLLDDHPDLADETLKLLTSHLYRITRVIPHQALNKLRDIPIWVEYKYKRHPCMCYHPSKEWLTQNGFNPEKAGSVEVANAENFLTWTIGQPWMVLHELAHGYHHLVLGHDNVKIKEAYKKALEAGKYESVLHINGEKRRAYALNNDQEYFAETAEAYFGTNDFYPFVRSELKEHDPQMFELHQRLWSDKPIVSE
jgi:hypothetical protein